MSGERHFDGQPSFADACAEMELRVEVLVPEADPELFAAAVDRVDARRWDADTLRTSARRFDVSRFRERIRAIVQSAHERGRVPA